MLIKDKKITEEEILKIISSRENEPTISFEELYYDVLNYNPTI